MASHPPNYVAVGLVPFPGEQGGKAFEKDCGLSSHAARGGKDQKCEAPLFDFTDMFIVLSPFLYLI